MRATLAGAASGQFPCARMRSVRLTESWLCESKQCGSVPNADKTAQELQQAQCSSVLSSPRSHSAKNEFKHQSMPASPRDRKSQKFPFSAVLAHSLEILIMCSQHATAEPSSGLVLRCVFGRLSFWEIVCGSLARVIICALLKLAILSLGF